MVRRTLSYRVTYLFALYTVTIFKITPTKTLRDYYNFIILIKIVRFAFINT